MQVERF